ncbi:MAG: peptidyl-prolyl cis-trans isomerase [Sulfurovaceae bacterium]|nr:peptidyl-prolyl cis-trans isomerase [Sulfurovaceae bacterium]
MKKILPLLLLSLMGSHAQIIDAIAIDVNGEPITILEIQAVQKKQNISKKAAVKALIEHRLEKGVIEKANITVSDADVIRKSNQIAQSRGMSIEQMKQVLTSKGLTWNSYQEQLRMELKKEIFFKKNIAASISQPSDAELKLFYETHKDKFAAASSAIQMSLVVYSSKSSQKLQEVMKNPLRKVEGVEQKPVLASSSSMNPQLLKVIQDTPKGSFTKPINTGRGFVAYYVKSKGGQGQGGFESVKNTVVMQWLQAERVKAGKDYINKLKANADIRIIRL